MKAKLFTLIMVVLTFSFTCQGQLKSILIDPATDQITIKNFGSSTIDITNYWLCNFPAYDQFSSTTIVGTGDFNLSPDEEVTVTWESELDDSDGEFGIYNTDTFNSSSAMEDYMQWGTSGHQRESVAVSKGIWTVETTVTVAAPYEYTGDGSEHGASFYSTVLSIDDNDFQNFKLFPNPGRSLVNLQLPFIKNDTRLKVFNILGNDVTGNIKLNLNNEIDVSNWHSGLYLFLIHSPESTKIKRFIKL